MAKDTTGVAGSKPKRTRSNKAKRFYLMFEGSIDKSILNSMKFAKNGDEALDLQEIAKSEGRDLSFTRVTLPASPKKETATV